MTYKILHYRLPGWIAYGYCVKVDVLTSGTINLPAILASDTPQINNILVIQLFDPPGLVAGHPHNAEDRDDKNVIRSKPPSALDPPA